jgi:hypothetical protein
VRETQCPLPCEHTPPNCQVYPWDHTSRSHGPCTSMHNCSSSHLCSQDRASGHCNPYASGHVCASPHPHSQDHTSRPQIHHTFASTCLLQGGTPGLVYLVHIILNYITVDRSPLFFLIDIINDFSTYQHEFVMKLNC